MRLILLRHGETTWNAEQRLQGQDNSDLSERGIQQARRFLGFARALNPQRVVSSDLGRTRQTAHIIGHGDCPADARLRELDMGEWTGRIKSDLIAGHAEDYHAWRAGTFTPPRAETWTAFRDRIAAGIRDWMGRGEGDILAIVHGGVIRAACHEFLGLPPSRVIPVTPGTATILNFADGGAGAAQLEGYNIGAVVPDLSVAD
ncbi:MAG: histidine phosphatase family protein [Devosia sp.]|mgnify:CR=1 FL=1|uniref:histidine phosphatase family protein n=1 Tax=Devosia sp. 66-22 TaxID=1895753 RepID=UPI00092B8A25|nr:histidine phosphatase family protein [Devosia sp. 66-22]MBN9347282.1 histidine phosphatase family protein [Devosia sp.]OJX49729.1 MAG: histidine phosphatase family protein [Devosia sp. 66-22]